MFPPQSLPLPGEILLITDQLNSPADFLLHRNLSTHLKDSKLHRCLLVSVSEDLARWKAVAGRSGVNLAQAIDSGAVAVVDIMQDFARGVGPEPTSSAMRQIFHGIKERLDSVSAAPEANLLVILDDIASLEWIGIPLDEILRFSRALCALCRKKTASLIVRHHLTTPDDPDDLFRHLLQLCTYHMDVFPLSSGRSGSVSGQVALHAGPATLRVTHKLIPRSVAVQYRLTDSGSVFFERGTGGGVL